MSFLIFLLQFDWNKLRPENIFGRQILERTPAGLSIIYMAGIALLMLFLMLSFIRNLRPKFAFEEDLPKEVSTRLSLTHNQSQSANLAVYIYILTLTVYGFHVYWTILCRKNNEQFQALSYKDLRSGEELPLRPCAVGCSIERANLRMLWHITKLIKMAKLTALFA